MAFDYDGTLAPIVDDPHQARMRTATQEALTALTALAAVARIAVISGRARSDLKKFLPACISYAIGNHGLEGLPGGQQELDRAAAVCEQWKTVLKPKLSQEPGLVLEDKTYSLTLHYRQATQTDQAAQTILAALEGLAPPPRVVMGKCVVNLLVGATPHKGAALLELMRMDGSEAAVFFGDDDNDEDAFELPAAQVLSIRVGFSAHSAAAFYLRDQSEIDRCLLMMTAFKTPV